MSLPFTTYTLYPIFFIWQHLEPVSEFSTQSPQDLSPNIFTVKFFTITDHPPPPLHRVPWNKLTRLNGMLASTVGGGGSRNPVVVSANIVKQLLSLTRQSRLITMPPGTQNKRPTARLIRPLSEWPCWGCMATIWLRPVDFRESSANI